MNPKKYLLLIAVVILFLSSNIRYSYASLPPLKQVSWKHNYSQTLTMKMLLSIPDQKGGSEVFCNFEKALQIIKETDYITLQVPKIIYLVGWQYNGHDDKYPAFFKVNEALKREQDVSAKESMEWLIKEAKKYHTTVSLHINMTDAYEDSPLWSTYVKKNLISKSANGKLMVIGNYNGRKAYEVNYRNEWKSGWAQKRIDSLLNYIPLLKDGGTIHIDAWIARENKGDNESAIEEAKYQKKIANYWIQKGIDPTSEWMMDYMVGTVPFAWHFNGQTQQGYMNIPAHIYTGSGLNPDIKSSDFGLGFLFGESMYGEGLFPNKRNKISDTEWSAPFAQKFYLNCLQYFFLNSLNRLSLSGEGNNRIVQYSEGCKVSLKDSTIIYGENTLRSKETVCFPLKWRNDGSYGIYSNLKEQWVTIHLNKMSPKSYTLFEVSTRGYKRVKRIVKDNKQCLNIKVESKQPYLLLPGEY